MPTELSRSREGENQRSDQVSTRRDASSRNGGQVHDFATWAFQRHEKQRREAEQRRDGKGPALAEIDTKRAIAENGDFVPRTVNLASESTEDNPKLLGGGDKLPIGALKSIKRLLGNIEDDFNGFTNNGKHKISKSNEKSINGKLANLKNELGRYISHPNIGDDYDPLIAIQNDVPESATDNVFLNGIGCCLQRINSAINGREKVKNG